MATVLVSLSLAAQEDAQLVVRTNVAGAQVVVDGDARGEAPRRLTLEPGTHTIRVEKDGYQPWEDWVELEAGEERTLIALLTSTSGQESELSPDEILAQADRFYDNEDWPGVIAACEQFLAVAPDHGDADYARRLVEIAQQHRDALDNAALGRALLDNNKWQEALQLADRWLDVDPYNEDALALRRRARDGERLEARERVALLVSRGRARLDAQDWETALELAQSALAIDLASEEATALRDQALAGATLAQDDQRREAETLVRRGQRMLETESWEEALELADRVLQLDPDNTDALRLRGSADAALQATRLFEARRVAADSAAAPTEEASVEESLVEEAPAEETSDAAGAEELSTPQPPTELLRRAATARVDPNEFVEPQSGVRFLKVAPGTYEMGCTRADSSCGADERPAHTVTLSKAFYLAETETTQRQYRTCVDDRRCPALLDKNSVPDPELADHPIHSVAWRDAAAFCKWIGGRLPTEAEWEYAARGGQARRRYHWGNSPSRDHANYAGRNGYDQWGKTSPVKSFPPNDFGFYDMLGNVWEWVADWHLGKYYSDSPPQDPQGPEKGSSRILRGGGAYNNPEYLRVSDRNKANPRIRTEYAGIRCALDELPPA